MSAMVDGLVGFEREEDRFWGWGAAMDDGEFYFILFIIFFL